ncbi:hypothetical protein N657DRAFT_646938 [Parathielavia appendiculata]|uniref:Uncharacterized protein n=1 Tax=Parathielavia appendiculata TaxID=2587402 RepID=A0AAN6Z268_9PEZI|nr:hypothetical protein N657DRAFT_646938 [Parathielavia appendiculata]
MSSWRWTAIRDAGLPHPDGELLESFTDQAIDSERAASYFLQRWPSYKRIAGLTAFFSEWIELISNSKPYSSITQCSG